MAEEKDYTAYEQVKEIGNSPSAKAIHDAIYKEAESELERPSSNLFWSGLAAGLSMSLSLIVEGVLGAYLPDAEWTVLVSSFGYTIGFVIVILGKQQLFTENTLTPILPLLHHKTLEKFRNVMRLWGVALFANLLGTLFVALVVAHTSAFDPHVLETFAKLGHEAMQPDFGTVLLRGVFAGWLIALMVWLLPYAGTARVWIIILITYVVAIGHFSHVIAGSMETFTIAAMGETTWGNVLLNYTLPALIGNILGGVVLVAAINHAQIQSGDKEKSHTQA
ncbi:formate/nitrite transporter family protein [Pontibacter anaerobius]|uniref:Formate/nitrite transporter family protein n=1 Tax=Pontibacter anaerobius TaxID=2993940 RepID=A0ABT3RHJ3_9BACT|nr:formate/nitrite transporter family protein [Pontibacter anaerobius]MCX2740842.1 formate/nitrite transporter family protein [Pontibacter anaerobius]